MNNEYTWLATEAGSKPAPSVDTGVPGLVVLRWNGTYRITHAPTGRMICGGYDTRDEAIADARRLRAVNWAVSMDDLPVDRVAYLQRSLELVREQRRKEAGRG